MQSSHDFFTVARDLIRRKQYQEAEGVLLDGLAANPENGGLLGLLAELYLKTGKTEQAERYNSKALAINPSDHFALQRKGDILARKKEYPEALAIFENLLATSGGNPFLYARIAKTHLLLKNQKKALEILHKAIAQFPERADLHYQAFSIYREAGMHDEAAKSIAEAARLEPENELYRSMKLSLRAEAESAENLEEAVELAGQNDAGMLRILARKFKKEGEIEKAIEIFKKIVALDDSDFSRKELAFAYYHNKDFSRAFFLFMTLSNDSFSEAPFLNSIMAAAKTREEKEALIERMARIAAAGNKSLWGKVNKLKKELSQNENHEKNKRPD